MSVKSGKVTERQAHEPAEGEHLPVVGVARELQADAEWGSFLFETARQVIEQQREEIRVARAPVFRWGLQAGRCSRSRLRSPPRQR